MFNLKKLVTSVRQSPNEKGQGLVEYALILVLVAIVVIAVLLVLGPAVSGVYVKVKCGLEGGSCIGPYTNHDFPDHADACPMLNLEPGGQFWTWDVGRPAGATSSDTYTVWASTSPKIQPVPDSVMWPNAWTCP